MKVEVSAKDLHIFALTPLTRPDFALDFHYLKCWCDWALKPLFKVCQESDPEAIFRGNAAACKAHEKI